MKKIILISLLILIFGASISMGANESLSELKKQIEVLKKENKQLIQKLAEKESEIIFLPTEKLDEWLVKYKSWRNFVIDSYNIRLNEMMETIDSLAFMRMDERLFKYLTDKAQIMRETSLNTTHQEIASDLNTSRVVISRLLKQLENEEKISLHRNRIEILNF